MAENRELDALDVNQPKESLTTHTNMRSAGVKNLALTFGTLLSSQGADAQEVDPRGLRPWRLVLPYAVHGSLSHPGV